MIASEIMGWLGGIILISVTFFYMVFGNKSTEHKNINIFGKTSVILGAM